VRTSTVTRTRRRRRCEHYDLEMRQKPAAEGNAADLGAGAMRLALDLTPPCYVLRRQAEAVRTYQSGRFPRSICRSAGQRSRPRSFRLFSIDTLRAAEPVSCQSGGRTNKDTVVSRVSQNGLERQHDAARTPTAGIRSLQATAPGLSSEWHLRLRGEAAWPHALTLVVRLDTGGNDWLDRTP
jgi:hypothetical protein